jgi:hypothetical protein
MNGSIGWKVWAAAVLLLVPAGLRGQEIRSPYRFVDANQAVGVFGGYVITDRGNLELGPESAPVFGARYRIRVSGPIDVAGSVGLLPTSRSLIGLDTTATDTSRVRVGETDLTLLLLEGALRFNVTGPRTYRGMQPYLALSLGVAIDASGTSAEEEELLPVEARFDFGTSFAAGIGGGVDIYLRRGLSVGLDARDTLWKLSTPRALLAADMRAPESEWTQNLQLSAGVWLHF